MSQQGLLMDLPIAEPLTKVTPYHRGEIRVKRPVRNQVEMMVPDLDSLLADDHTIRSIWEFLNKLDLSAFYSSIKAALDQPGRPASDPQVLLALWVYATAIIREYKFVKLTCQVACNSPIPRGRGQGGGVSPSLNPSLREGLPSRERNAKRIHGLWGSSSSCIP